MTQIYRMSLLIRRCRLDNYWRCTKLVKRTAFGYELRASSHLNLKTSARHLCDARANSNVLDDKIRKCLDYLADEYKSEIWKNDSLLELIDLNAIGGLLNERTKLVENIQNLQDLGRQHKHCNFARSTFIGLLTNI